MAEINYQELAKAVEQGVVHGMEEASAGMGAGGNLRGVRGDKMDPKTRAAQEKRRKILADQSKTYRELVKQLKQNEVSSDELKEAVNYGNVVFDRAIDQGFKTNKVFGTLGGSLDKLPKAFSSAINASGSEMAAELAGEIKTLDDAFKAQQKFSDLPEVSAMMEEFTQGKMSFTDLRNNIIGLGFTVKDTNHILGDFTEDMIDADDQLKINIASRDKAAKAIGNFKEEVLKTQKSLVKLGKQQHGVAGRFGDVKDSLKDISILGIPVGQAITALTGAALGYLKVLSDTTSASLKFGTSLQMTDAALMGMQMAELGEMQSKYRNTILASGKGFSEFNQRVKDSNDRLMEYTGDLAEASRLSAHLMDANLRLGGSADTSAKFMDDQTAMLHTFNRVLGVTAEQFREMNNEIINSTDVRASLFKMDKTQRTQRLLDIQQSIKQYTMGGMAIDQAKQLAMHFEKLRGEDPMDRIKRAFRTRALMGAAGVSGGAEVGRAIIAGPRATAEQRAAEESGALRTQQSLAGMAQSGLGGEIFGSLMVGKLGLGETFGAKGAMVDPILEVGRAAHDDSEKLLTETVVLGKLGAQSNDLLSAGLMLQAQTTEMLKTGGLAAAGMAPDVIKNLQKLGVVEGNAPSAIQEVTSGVGFEAAILALPAPLMLMAKAVQALAHTTEEGNVVREKQLDETKKGVEVAKKQERATEEMLADGKVRSEQTGSNRWYKNKRSQNADKTQ